jgi:DNA-directed RNA polymerase subunit RPC12/RpoP
MSSSNGHISFACTECSQPIRLRSEFAGRRCRCRNCAHEMTVPTQSAEDSDLGGSDTASKKFLGRKREFRDIPRCPACNARLVLIGTMKSQSTLRCGHCGEEFMNQFFDRDKSDESAGPGGVGISQELRESWKGIFGGKGG